MSKKATSKGANFEERLRTYFDQAGFFAVRSVPFRFEDEDVSDVDVWLYERPNAIARRRTIVDAKNRHRPRAVERILWLKGFQEGLKVESAVVATTDRRASIKRFASSVGVALLDGDAIQRLDNTEKLDDAARLSGEEFLSLLTQTDKAQSNKQWKTQFETAKSGLVTNLGFLSANQAIEGSKFFLDNVAVQQGSSQKAALRAFLVLLSYAAISLDFAAKDFSFRSLEDRNEALVLGLRFGEGGASSTLESVRMGIRLVRQYADNGNAVARQVETKFKEAANSLPVEIIAEHVAKIAPTDGLFRAAKDLDSAGYARRFPNFDSLSLESKSFLGAVLDYFGMPRKELALWMNAAATNVKASQSLLPFAANDKQ
jgi:hypothetical protein